MLVEGEGHVHLGDGPRKWILFLDQGQERPRALEQKLSRIIDKGAEGGRCATKRGRGGQHAEALPSSGCGCLGRQGSEEQAVLPYNGRQSHGRDGLTFMF